MSEVVARGSFDAPGGVRRGPPAGGSGGLRSRAQRINRWTADHFCVSALVFTFWTVCAYLRLWPRSLESASGRLKAGYHAWAYYHLAYSDVLALYREHHLFAHPLPYIHAPIEYPVVTGVFMWLASLFPGVGGYFLATAFAFLVIGLVTLRVMKGLCPRTYHVLAFSPLLLFYVLLNWDLLGICFMVIGWWFVRERRWAPAGIAIALGGFAKLFPFIAVPFLVVELVRDRDRRGLRAFVAGLCVTSVVINLPFMVGGTHNWLIFFTYNATRQGTAAVLTLVGFNALPVGVSDAMGLVVIGTLTTWLCIRVYRGGNSRRAAAYVFAAFLLVSKVYSPQYTLWLPVFGLLAEWPAWTCWVLAGAGVLDYYNSFIFLHLSLTGAKKQVFDWYAHHVFNWGTRVRYVAVILCVTASLLKDAPVLGSRSSEREPMTAGRERDPLVEAGLTNAADGS